MQCNIASRSQEISGRILGGFSCVDSRISLRKSIQSHACAENSPILTPVVLQPANTIQWHEAQSGETRPHAYWRIYCFSIKLPMAYSNAVLQFQR